MPKNVDHDERRQELAAAVLRVIQREGLAGATIRGVAAEAGWTRGVIAHYFTSRDDLLLFAYREGVKSMRASLQADGNASPLWLLRRWLRLALPTDGQSALNYAIYLGFAESAMRDPSLARSVEAETAEIDDFTRELVARCIAEGELQPPFDAGMAADLLITLTDGAALGSVMDPRRFTPQRVDDMLESLLESWTPCDL